MLGKHVASDGIEWNAAISAARSGLCKVLMVDDDPVTRDAYAEVAEALGYQVVQAADGLSALKLLADDQAIGIVVTDLQMPLMDGMSLLDEVAMRFAPNRPIVTIALTGFATMDAVVQAMRYNAQDFLAKPASTQDLAAALRRASAGWTQLAMRRTLDSWNPPAESDPVNSAPPQIAPRPAEDEASELLSTARWIRRSRDRRAAFFDAQLFADPCWDIMLDLMCGQLEDQPVPVSSACLATGLPFSTALRHVRHLVDLGLIHRWQDPKDKRRDLLALDARTFETMKAYLIETRKRFA